MNFQFTKMHALGNDFVVIDAITQHILMTRELVQLLSDRHCGVGCDQVLVLSKTQHLLADFHYRIFNPDGSEVFQCGNGARCMGLFVQQKKLSDKKTIRLETKRGLMTVTCVNQHEVIVDIAKPDFNPTSLPFVTSEMAAPYAFDVVSVGNPHCVMRDENYSEADIIFIGETLNQHSAFPEGVNVGFVKYTARDRIHLRVYERGAGLTQACGSGACAAVAVGRRYDLLDPSVIVHQQGGSVRVMWDSLDSMIQLSGPVVTVFDGVWREKL